MQDVLQKLQDPEMIAELSRSTGVSEEDIKKIAALGIPSLVEGMNQNANDEEAAKSLGTALDDHEDEDLSDNQALRERYLDKGEGNRIIDHIFPSKKKNVEEDIAERTGTSSQGVNKVLSILAPLVLASMASNWSKKKKEEQVQQRYDTNQKPQYRPEDIRDITMRTKRQTQQQADNPLIDIAKDVFNSSRKKQSGGILDDLLGGLFK